MRSAPFLVVSALLTAVACVPVATTKHPPAPAKPLPFATGDFQWKAQPDIDGPRDHHSTVVSDASGAPFLYVLGGFTPNGARTDVELAPVHADGTLGAWTPTTDLPRASAGQGAAVVGDRIYICGGTTGFASPVGNVEFAQMKADGTLGAWTETEAMPVGHYHIGVVVDGSTLYAVGGLDPGNNPDSEVYRTHVNDDGTLAPWTTETALPTARTHHVEFIHGGFLYVQGGFSATALLDDMIRAPLADDGSVGAWETVADHMGLSLSGHAATIVDDVVFLVPGTKDLPDGTEKPDDQIMRFGFDADDKPTTPAALQTALPLPRNHRHQAPIFEGHMFLVGGRDDTQAPTTNVAVGAISD